MTAAATHALHIASNGDLELIIRRAFDAPRQLVFDAWTRPDLLPQWLGVHNGWTMPVCQVDLRPGGAYRYEWRKAPANKPMGLGGVFQEIAAPDRIVATEQFDDPWYPGEAVNTWVLTEQDGRTLCTLTTRYQSKEARDTVLGSGMEGGLMVGFQKLDQLLAEMLRKDARQFLRHTLATLAYRAGKVLRDTPEDFAGFRLSPQARTAQEILSHMGDLMEWGEHMARGEYRWQPVEPASWDAAHDRFFGALARFDAALAQRLPESLPDEQLFQGPVADALTHTGQLAMMRGVCGSAVRPESYARAEIRTGRVGPDQAAPNSEFDGDASKRRAAKKDAG
ncbi:MAG: hypothetical protein FJW20_14800 [Acidimicrobiia bacterium]|nr:hypothetical protein [Acidimicrobiia bacterium]